MSGRLADNVALFGRALRAAGLPVGPGHMLDAVAAVELAGLSRRDDLYWTLHAIFVARREQSEIFEAAFRLFWRRRGYVDALEAEMPAGAPAGSAREEPKPGEARVREALRPSRQRPEEDRVEEEVTARLATSDSDAFKTRDFAQMSAAEIARAKRLIAALALWMPAGTFLEMLMVMSIAGGAVTIVMIADRTRRRRWGDVEVPYGVAIAVAALLMLPRTQF